MNSQRILFIAEGQLGDLLLLTPALRAAKESFPQSFISVLVVERRNSDDSKQHPFDDLTATSAERESSVLSTNKNVDELLVLNRQALRFLNGLARVRAELAIITFLRRKRFDTVICTFPEDRFVQWAIASGARIRVGQRKQGLHWLLTHKPNIEKSQRGVLKYYCELERAVGATVHSTETEYIVPESSKKWADDFLRSKNISSTRQVVAIHPGASGDYKIWPPERYALVIDHLAKKGLQVLLLNGAIDEQIINEIRKRVQHSFVEVRTGNKVGDLAAIIQRCELCITNDSGPRHLAVAVGTLSLAFFRQHHDTEWGVYEENNWLATLKASGQCPVCPPDVCLDKIPEGERFASHCLRMICVEEAVQQVEKMLATDE